MATQKEETTRLTRDVLRRLGYEGADLEVDITDEVTQVSVRVNEDAGMLIGKKGETLRALQHLLLLLISRQTGVRFGPGEFVFDINNYQKERENQLIALAKNTAHEVREQKRPQELAVMPAVERRIVHITLAEESGVTTESTGERGDRRVVVRPS